MKTLYINTCSIDIIIKLFRNNKIIKEETICGQKNGSQFIMPTIKKVLGKDSPDAIIVAIGPGSFTGVRLGVTIAKTFAYIKNIPIKTITTLEEKAVSIKLKNKIISVKENNGYFIGHFDIDNNLTQEYYYLSNEEYNIFKTNNKVYCNVRINYKKIKKFINKRDNINTHSIKPVYVKVIEALK